MYELGCCRSLALVKGGGEASGACTDGACADGACVGGACADGAYADGAACWGTDDIRVNGRNLRRRLITYELKGPSVLMNSLISLSNYSIRLSL